MGAICVVGCGPSGPELGEVSGTITMDGKPVEGAYVTFLPMFPDGIEMYAEDKTGPDGKYVMQFSADRNGVMIGKHQILVSTMDDIKLPDGRNQKVPERIPRIYVNEKSPLEFDVQPGENIADFDLSSDAK